jgi:hypothetical protein
MIVDLHLIAQNQYCIPHCEGARQNTRRWVFSPLEPPLRLFVFCPSLQNTPRPFLGCSGPAVPFFLPPLSFTSKKEQDNQIQGKAAETRVDDPFSPRRPNEARRILPGRLPPPPFS